MNNLSVFQFFIILFSHFILNFVRGESDVYTLSDFYSVQWLEVVNYINNPLTNTHLSNTYTITQTKFKDPQVLICLTQLDMDSSKTYIAYKVDSTVNGNQITISAQKYYDTYVSNIIIMYMIISHPSIFVQKGTITIPPSNQDLIISTTLAYQRVSSNPPKIQAYILGYKNQIKTGYNKLKISVVHNQSSFELVIERSDIGFQEVYYNYIEIYDDQSIGFQSSLSSYSQKPYYVLDLKNVNDYSNSVITLLNNQVAERFSNQIGLPVDITFPSTSSYNSTDIGFFIGFTHFEFDFTNRNSGLRLQMDQMAYKDKVFSYKYRTWHITKVRGVTTTYLYFKMRNCYHSFTQQSIEKHICIKECSAGLYGLIETKRDIKSCTICNDLCKTCNGGTSNDCLSCDDGRYLNSQNSCSKCPDQCETCSSQSICSSCNKQYPYFYQNFCYAQPPLNTFCNQSTFICSPCNPRCKTCASDLTCLTCQDSSDYFFNGKCSQNQPENTYCNSNRVCTQCSQGCDTCNSLLKCLKCQNPNDFFYQGQCTSIQPQFTYCTENQTLGILKYCKQCHSTCTQCFGPSMNECTSCSEDFQLENTTCHCKSSGLSYNEKSQTCEKCFIEGCISCKKDINFCDACTDEFKLDNSSCICKDSLQYYNSIFKMCFKNTIENCKVSDKTQNKCIECKEGFLNYQNIMCSFCGKYKYADSSNKCTNDCQKNCLLCSSNTKCALQDNQANQNNSNQSQNESQQNNSSNSLCHYSCSLCNGTEQDSCVKCNSNDNRQYNLETSICQCMKGYSDIGKQACQINIDLSDSLFSTGQILFYVIMLSAQVPFIFFDKFQYINCIFSTIQLISIISLDPFFSSDLLYRQFIQLFQYLGLYNTIQAQLITTDDLYLKQSLNSIILLAAVQVISIVLYSVFCAIQSKISSILKQILTSTNRFTSTIQLLRITLLITKPFSLQPKYLTFLILALLIQLVLTSIALYLIITQLKQSKYSNQSLPTQSNLLDEPFKAQLENKNEQQLSQFSHKLQINNLFYEIRKIITVTIFAVINYSTYSYYLYFIISILAIAVFLYLKPFKNKLENVISIVVELIVSIIFCLCFHLKRQSNIADEQINYYILGLAICFGILFIIVLFSAIVNALSMKQFIFKEKSDKQISSIENHVQKERVPETITKDQIDMILSSQRWDFSTFEHRKYRMSIYSIRDTSKSLF